MTEPDALEVRSFGGLVHLQHATLASLNLAGRTQARTSAGLATAIVEVIGGGNRALAKSRLLLSARPRGLLVARDNGRRIWRGDPTLPVGTHASRSARGFSSLRLCAPPSWCPETTFWFGERR